MESGNNFDILLRDVLTVIVGLARRVDGLWCGARDLHYPGVGWVFHDCPLPHDYRDLRSLGGRAAVDLDIRYASPEFLNEGKVDERSDVFALGVHAYVMLTGRDPFPRGVSVVDAVTTRLTGPFEPIGSLREECPAELEDLVMKCLSPNPEGRFQTARDLIAALHRAEEVTR